MTKLGDCCQYVTDKAEISVATKGSYISTENMIPEAGGVSAASSVPSSGKATVFKVGDTLLSNIRPYFRKVWHADRCGLCSADVLVFRAKGDAIIDQFLYYLISSNEFIAYDVATSKGTKMPRGDKAAIMRYEFNLPSLIVQKQITSVLGAMDKQIAILNRTNGYLAA